MEEERNPINNILGGKPFCRTRRRVTVRVGRPDNCVIDRYDGLMSSIEYSVTVMEKNAIQERLPQSKRALFNYLSGAALRNCVNVFKLTWKNRGVQYDLDQNGYLRLAWCYRFTFRGGNYFHRHICTVILHCFRKSTDFGNAKIK